MRRTQRNVYHCGKHCAYEAGCFAKSERMRLMKKARRKCHARCRESEEYDLRRSRQDQGASCSLEQVRAAQQVACKTRRRARPAAQLDHLPDNARASVKGNCALLVRGSCVSQFARCIGKARHDEEDRTSQSGRATCAESDAPIPKRGIPNLIETQFGRRQQSAKARRCRDMGGPLVAFTISASSSSRCCVR